VSNQYELTEGKKQVTNLGKALVGAMNRLVGVAKPLDNRDADGSIE